ncbi:MAG: IclR family transcriptional regulator [Actinomycetales bacterium]
MSTLGTVAKVGRVLDLFTPENPEWGVSEVGAELAIPRSSAHALLSSLTDIGLLQWREGGRYRIGWRVIELAEVRRSMVDVRACAAPVMQELVHRYGETVHLAVRYNFTVLYIDKILGTHNITVQGARVGARLECHCTAVGKTLLGHADESVLESFLATGRLSKHTPSTIVTQAAFRRELEQIRRRGYGFDLGEAVEDVYCVAAPIRDEFGQVIAALSMSSPSNRFGKYRETYAKAIVHAALSISRAMVDSPPRLPDPGMDYPEIPK